MLQIKRSCRRQRDRLGAKWGQPAIKGCGECTENGDWIPAFAGMTRENGASQLLKAWASLELRLHISDFRFRDDIAALPYRQIGISSQ